MPASAYDLELTETFAGPPAAVFAAWTETDRLIQWWRIPGFTTPAELATVDPREGGAWSVTVVGDSGGSIPFLGTLRVVDPPSRLVITLDNEPSPDAAQHSELHITLHAVPAGTRMEFHHHGFGDAAEVDELRGGYAGVFFPSLAAFLASAPEN